MRKKATIIPLLILFISSAFIWPRKKTTLPPGTFEVRENFYSDKEVITNFAWLEYTTWLKSVFGEESLEYKNAQPNIDVWGEEFICLLQLRKTYNNAVNYKDYPVVGVSQNQAKAYLKWRSDRVMEYFLIRKNVIKRNKEVNAENYFTIEKYFAGKYFNKVPHKFYNMYPVYSLPTVEQHEELNTIHSTYGNEEVESPCYFDSLKQVPLKATTNSINFADALSEWTKEDNSVYGKNWRKTDKEGVWESKKATNYIGFRAVCTWKVQKD